MYVILEIRCSSTFAGWLLFARGNLDWLPSLGHRVTDAILCLAGSARRVNRLWRMGTLARLAFVDDLPEKSRRIMKKQKIDGQECPSSGVSHKELADDPKSCKR